ncbi:MAG: PepSY domain-containing protein [Pseudodesulfovibrio sp.]|uniref:PepSY domain-containing protein n=1 Tax=Pseudodesulfovibrio sp. TaxID=2035812 RepID=UPI003D1469A3
MKKQWIAIIGGIAMVIGIVTAGVGFAESEHDQRITGTIPVSEQSEGTFPSKAKISLDQAMKSAVASVPGQVLKAELENEDGFLIYNVEVASPDQTVTEVQLDAGSGKVLAMHKDKADRHEHDKEDREHDEQEGHEGEE